MLCKKLLEDTFERRRKWISEEAPHIQTVFSEFPLLLSLSLVRNCIETPLGQIMDNILNSLDLSSPW